LNTLAIALSDLPGSPQDGNALTCQPAVRGPRLTRRLIPTLRRHWFVAANFSLLGGILVGLALWISVPSFFTAEAFLEVRMPRHSAGVGADLISFQKAQGALLQCPTVILAAIRQPEVVRQIPVQDNADPFTWLEKHLSVEDSRPGLLRVRVGGEGREQVCTMLHALIRSFLQELAAQLRLQLTRLRDGVADEDRRLLERKQHLARLDDPRLQIVQKDLLEALSDLRRARVELALGRGMEAEIEGLPASEVAIQEFLERDPTSDATRKEIAQVEDQMRRVERVSVLGTKDPAWLGAERKRAGLLAKLHERRQEANSIVGQRERERARSELTGKLRELRCRTAALEEVTARLQAEIGRLGGGAPGEADRVRGEVAVLESSLRARLCEVRSAEEDLTTPPVQWHGESETSCRRDGSLRNWFAGSGGVCAFLLIAVSVAWCEARRQRVEEVADLAAVGGLRVVGTVPIVPLRARSVSTLPAGGRLAARQTRLHEAIDALRTLVLHVAGEGPRMIVVSSAARGEGKTTVAVQLAASLARAWRKTLLIDADTRNPGVQAHFGIPLEPGFCEVLRGEVEAAEVILPTTESRLWVLPAGHGDAHAVAVLGQPGAKALLRGFKEQYDFLVFDAPPVLQVSDALVLSQHADKVLLAVRCRASRLPAVLSARQRLAALEVPLLGAVVIGSDTDLDDCTPPETAQARG
jgi:capsular exopolysaccharide synthesis family protein